jgi:glycosyltransferase involved in cell wall biosynthesis
MVFVESQINADDCERQGIRHRTAFGINDEIFFPKKLPKVFTATLQATCASWKRQGLASEALGRNIVFCGRDQKSDPQPFIDARKSSLVLPELPMEAVATLINSSDVVLNTASYWGGGQRATLEALACNVPVICCDDSPKNMEYVIESGCGIVCKPEVESIRNAVLQAGATDFGSKGIDYIQKKWTARCYADSLLVGIKEIL